MGEYESEEARNAALDDQPVGLQYVPDETDREESCGARGYVKITAMKAAASEDYQFQEGAVAHYQGRRLGDLPEPPGGRGGSVLRHGDRGEHRGQDGGLHGDRDH